MENTNHTTITCPHFASEGKGRREEICVADQSKDNQKFIGNDSAQYDGLSQEKFIVEIMRTRFGDKAEQSGIGKNGADILQIFGARGKTAARSTTKERAPATDSSGNGLRNSKRISARKGLILA